MTIEERLQSIEQRGWRLHQLSSEPGRVTMLQWGASIRVNERTYGHSYGHPSANAALDCAFFDAEQKNTRTPPELHQQWNTTVNGKKKRVTLTIEDIFGASTA